MTEQNLHSLPVTWGNPEGELFMFSTAEEVKKLFSKSSLSEYELDLIGIGVSPEGSPSEEETCLSDEELEKGQEWIILPIMRKNPYFTTENQCASHSKSWKRLLKPEDLVLDDEVWTEFPCVAYLNFSQEYDRIGKVSTLICKVTPLSQLLTTSMLEAEERKYKETWINKLQKTIDFEEERMAYFKNKTKQESNNAY